MAEAFLRQLLQVPNRVRPDEEQKCSICMEECGTMDQETGLLELAIRLPFCKHIVGSGCIAKWLHSNNTCPICRHVFFPAQSRPYLEHGIMEGQTDHVETNRARTRSQILNGPISGILDFLEEMRRLCDDYCTQLGLQPDVSHLAGCVLGNLLEPGSSSAILQDQSDHYIVAVSIYIASNLTGHPRSPREISGVMDSVDGHHIHVTYNLLTDRRAIIHDGIRDELNEVFNIQTLIWPLHGHELTARESALEDLTQICSSICIGLCVFVPFSINMMAQTIASRVWNIASLHQTHRSPRSLAAACVYMAGHLIAFSIPLSMISPLSHVSEDNIAEIYRLLYAERERIVREHWFRYMGRDDMEQLDMESALALLPIV